jgi:hypothetical protein
MNITDDAFRAAVDADYAKKAPDLSKTLNVTGQVRPPSEALRDAASCERTMRS